MRGCGGRLGAPLCSIGMSASDSDEDFTRLLCRGEASSIRPPDSESDDEWLRSVCRSSSSSTAVAPRPSSSQSTAAPPQPSAPAVPKMVLVKVGIKRLLVSDDHPLALAHPSAPWTAPLPANPSKAPRAVKSAPVVRSAAHDVAGVLRGNPVPRGPLELPDAESSSDEGSDEERGPEDRTPSSSEVAHTMRKRISKAAKNGIGTTWCKLVSFHAVEDDVLAFSVGKINGELACRNGGRFKIGITICPYFRFVNRRFGYKWEVPPWGHMEVLWVSMPAHCGWLEKALIRHYRAVRMGSLQNIRDGDDNRPKVAPCFVYCVFGRPARVIDPLSFLIDRRVCKQENIKPYERCSYNMDSCW